MKAFLVIPAAVAGLVLASAGASAQGARPDNPSGLGRALSGTAKTNGGNGEVFRDIARPPNGFGAGDAIQNGRVGSNSTPNPPAKADPRPGP